MTSETVRLGIISDTHGLLRPQAFAALAGCSLIIHAGDVGKKDVLDRLRRQAPTVAVRGNVDKDHWCRTLPADLMISINGVGIYVLHDVQTLTFDPSTRKIRAVISGHSHRPVVEEKAGVLYLNPGAAGPRRFRLPVTLAHLDVDGSGQMRAELIDLKMGKD